MEPTTSKEHTLLYRSKHHNQRSNIFGKILHHRIRKSEGHPRTSLAQETQSRNRLGKRHGNLEKFGTIKGFGKTMATKKGIYQKGTTTEYERRRRPKNHSSNPLSDMDTILLELLDTENEVWINTKTNMATSLAVEANLKKPELTPKQLVPEEYHKYLDVFDEEKANRYPESRPWDHKIEMKTGFELKSFKTYNLTPEEQTKLDKFLKENLDKGYIKPSESPMASPFFFVKKKDGKL